MPKQLAALFAFGGTAAAAPLELNIRETCRHSGRPGNLVVRRRQRRASLLPRRAATFDDGRAPSRRVVWTGLGSAAGLHTGARWAPSAAAAAVAVATRVFKGRILKGQNDIRDYKAAELNNGLKVLLVSDPEATTAAAALGVHAGFYLDPEELPGLAHFCEHMLFLGTAEFPGEDSFRLFLTANGGSQNAFTTEQDTTYYFNSSPSVLKEGLVRFSSYFKSPLFTPSATDREIAAIDAEDAKNKQSDGFRVNQVTKSFAAAEHPQRRFGTGNRETLLSEPSKRGIDTRKALLDFFERYYDAGLMALCVVGKEPTSTLLPWVEETFGAIRGSRDLTQRPPMAQWRGVNPYPPIVEGGEAQCLEIVPVAERRTLSMNWPILFADDAAKLEWARCKPQSYITFLLGHEGKGSLLSYLKRRGLASAILAGAVREDDNFAQLRLSFELSDKGLQARDEVLGAAHAVLARLRQGIPRYVFTEYRDLAAVRWRFKGKEPSATAALTYVQNIQRGYEPQEYVSGRSLLFEPAERSVEDVVSAVLEQLRPETAQYCLVAKACAQSAQLSERWYGTRYGLAPIRGSVLQEWMRAVPLAEYALPEPNQFVPESFALQNQQVFREKKPEALAQPPTLVQDDAAWRIFFKPDRAFASPKAVIRILLYAPRDSLGEVQVASRMWLLSLADRLTEDFYSAAFAGLDFTVDNKTEGISIDFGGYSDKLVLLVEEVLARIQKFDGPTEDEFVRALDVINRSLASFDKQQPYQYAVYLSRLAMLTPETSVETLRQQAQTVTISQVVGFGQKLWSNNQQLYGQALLHGNLTAKDVSRVRKVLNGLPFASLARQQSSRVASAQLPLGQDVLLAQRGPNPDEVNNALLSLFFTGSGSEAVVQTLLLQSIVESPFFGRLRTEQQLGYVVLSQAYQIGSVARLGFIVQSSTKKPGALLNAVDEFLQSFRNILVGLSAREFSSYKIALVEKIVKQDERLSEESSRWWDEVVEFRYGWRLREEEAALVTSVSQAKLLEFFDSAVATTSPARRRLNVAVFAGDRGGEGALASIRQAAQAQGAIVIEDPVEFRSGLPKWPLVDRGPEDSL